MWNVHKLGLSADSIHVLTFPQTEVDPRTHKLEPIALNATATEPTHRFCLMARCITALCAPSPCGQLRIPAVRLEAAAPAARAAATPVAETAAAATTVS